MSAPSTARPASGHRSSRGAWRRILRAEHVTIATVGAVVAWLGVVPLGFLLWHAFFRDGTLTVALFRRAYGAYGLDTMLANSLWFAGGTTALAVIAGTVLAFLVARTDMPARTLVFGATLVPLVIPGVLYAIAWIFLASPRSGALNQALGHAGIDPINIFGVWGMVLVEGFHLTPLVFLVMLAGFRSVDQSLEETAMVAGASLPTVFRRITLRLVAPALSAAVLLVGVRAIEAFEVPALVGIPGGVWVFTSRIWRSLSRYPFDLGEAAAYSLPLLVLTAVGLFLHGRLDRDPRRFQSITGKGFRPTPIALGAWRWPALAACFAYTLVTVLLPLLILVYASTQRLYAPPSRHGFASMTLDNYRDVLGSEKTLHAFLNSLVLGVGTATAVMLLTAVGSWVLTRTKTRGRRLVDGLAFLPIAVPGIVLGVALLYVYLRLPVGIYGTLWILFVAYCTRFMPYGTRYASVSMAQIGAELEESARASGARWWQTFRRVLLPLALPGLVAGWMTILILSLRELVELAPPVLTGPRGAVDQDLGAVPERRAAPGRRARNGHDRPARDALRRRLQARRPGGGAGTMTMPLLSVRGLGKRFPDGGRRGDRGTVAVDGVSFDVEAGSLFTILGPSGCGKTTTLRCIAGLERPDVGEIALGGRVLFSSDAGLHVPPEERGLGMVFQSYAIWPHMNVFENAAFPLTVGPLRRRPPRKEVRARVERVLATVRLEHLADRQATQLSGGEQQRLALARALVMQPPLLLLDEPLSNLDARLREEMRFELRRVQQQLGVTTLYVTHDQLEALALSSAIAVMEGGRVQQVGSPREVYEHPSSRFVADFIGSANLIEGVVAERDGLGACRVETATGPIHGRESGGLPVGARVLAVVRPEHVAIEPSVSSSSGDPGHGTVESVAYFGDSVDHLVTVGPLEIRARTGAARTFAPGTRVSLRFPEGCCSILPHGEGGP